MFKLLKDYSIILHTHKFNLQCHSHSSKTTNRLSNPAIQFILDETKSLQQDPLPSRRFPPQTYQNPQEFSKELEISHPWPEWVELMEKLLKYEYFDEVGHPFGSTEMGSRECNQIRTACLNFARDRYDLIRYLSRKDIVVVAGVGCPSIDRKIVNSGKRLRAHVGIDEGNVCSTCILRGNCERAFVKAREDEGGRTVDVMRFLVAYGLDPVTGTVENKPCLNKKVKESTRTLLKEMVEFSSEDIDCQPPKATPVRSNFPVQGSAQGQIDVPRKQGDWICPRCNFLNFARNIKCLRCDGVFEERLTKVREDQEHIQLKKGDWICEKCNFLNFAKNTRCLQCKGSPPKRQLNPGEWECESCNYINFRRNMVCLKCDHRRPKSSNAVSSSPQPVSDNIGYPRRIRPTFGEEKNVYKFVDSESEYHENTNSWNQMPGLLDFPVVGGKSDLSQDVQKQENWKLELALRNKRVAKAKENADELMSSIVGRNCEYFQCTDGDEMADWFEDQSTIES